MSLPAGESQSTAPPGPPTSLARKNTLVCYHYCTNKVSAITAREPNATSSPRTSHSQTRELLYDLVEISSPVTPEIKYNIDIVAVHGLSEDADSTWVLSLSTSTEGGSGSTTGKVDATLDKIKEGGAVVGKKAGSLLKSTVNTAAKSLSYQPQQAAGAAKLEEEHTGKTSLQGGAKLPHIQSSKASSNRDIPAPAPPTTKVNWLKDDDMLRRSFPRARILQFSYAVDNSLKDVASGLLRRLSEKRKDQPGLSRPIIFIGHSFGGIVISEALVIANKGNYLDVTSATVGLVFCT